MVPDALGLAGFTLGKPDGCQFLVLLVSQIPPLAVSVPALVHHLLHERGTAVGLAAAASVRGSHLAFELCFQLLDAALGLLVLLNDRLRALDDLGPGLGLGHLGLGLRRALLGPEGMELLGLGSRLLHLPGLLEFLQ